MIPIVVVDDSREDLLLAERVFQESRIVNPLHLLSSGAACVAFLEKNYSPRAGDRPQACIIFLDLSMAPMSGIETMKEIQKLVLSAPPWIVMLSAMTDVKLIRQGYQLGARTFLNKPLRAKELEEFIANERALSKAISARGYELRWE